METDSLYILDVPKGQFLSQVAPRLLEEFACSVAWLEAMIEPYKDGASGHRVRVRRSICPPGGAAGTRMVRCTRCRRWTPPAWTDHRVCPDCQVQQDEDTFLDKARSQPDPSLLVELLRLGWRRNTCFRDMLRGRWDEFTDVRNVYSRNSGEREFRIRQVSVKAKRAFENHMIWVGKEQPEGIAPPFLYLEEIASPDRPADPPPAIRSAGCNSILLPEDKESLKDEIDEYSLTSWPPDYAMRDSLNPYSGKRGLEEPVAGMPSHRMNAKAAGSARKAQRARRKGQSQAPAAVEQRRKPKAQVTVQTNKEHPGMARV
jgi:hypothetical protein